MKLVMLDVDGTLVDSARIIIDAQVETFAAHGLAYPGREAGLAVVGLSLQLALAELARDAEIAPALTETYREVFTRMRRDPIYVEPLYPGVAETIVALSERNDIMLGIATGKSRRGAEYIIERERWHERFAVIRTADDGPSKPHPEMLLGACEITGIAPADMLMIGDSTFDMQMGKAAGGRSIAVSYGFQPVDRLLEAGADAVIDNFAELPLHLPDAPGPL